jgi:HAD superfamily hydrolase (TIGR01509 family)
MRMEALIFDMDGLMIDSERLYFDAERELAAAHGRVVQDSTLWKMMGRKPLESMRLFVEELGIRERAEDLLVQRDEVMRRKLASDLKPMPGLEHILERFRGKLKMAVATGAQREFLDITLDSLRIRDRFDVLQTSDGISRGKPDPEIYLAACAGLGLAPAACVVLEDAENGVRAARAAGCYVIAVPSEYSRTHDFSDAHFIASDLFQAADHVAGIAGAITEAGCRPDR